MQFTRKIRDHRQISIPSEVVECYNIKKGDMLVLDLVRVVKK